MRIKKHIILGYFILHFTDISYNVNFINNNVIQLLHLNNSIRLYIVNAMTLGTEYWTNSRNGNPI